MSKRLLVEPRQSLCPKNSNSAFLAMASFVLQGSAAIVDLTKSKLPSRLKKLVLRVRTVRRQIHPSVRFSVPCQLSPLYPSLPVLVGVRVCVHDDGISSSDF